MANTDLNKAKSGKNDEFYTQYEDIEKEIRCYTEYNPDVFRNKTVLCPCDNPEWSNFTRFFIDNFNKFGLKKLISTSIATNLDVQESNDSYERGLSTNSLFEDEDDSIIDNPDNHGRIFVLDKQSIRKTDVDNIKWNYLEGNGDFRSDEISRLRDEADVIITNPPFSLFRNFISWILKSRKHKLYSVVGNMNAVTVKEIFPLIKNNEMWLGPSISSGDREFEVPEDYPLKAAGWRISDSGKHYIRVKGIRWFTNIENGHRHKPLSLMSMRENIERSRHADVRNHQYEHYDNYDAIDVPFTDAIPSDYEDVMGVPISFLDKYCPEQFEILNANDYRTDRRIAPGSVAYFDMVARPVKNGEKVYRRIFIEKKNG